MRTDRFRAPMRLLLFIALLLAAASLSPPAHAGAPQVVASIQPLHSLAAGVMAGVGAPRLLVKGYGSPHAYQMRPSDAAALYDADLVLWMGVPLENFLKKPLANVAPPARVVSLLDSGGLGLLPNRESGVWDHDHAGTEPHGHGAGTALGANARDPHAWLSPDNARRMVEVIARVLAEIDPENAQRYRGNARALDARIREAAQAIDEKLAPVRQVRFIMFHDAFQYFERGFALTSAGALHLEPARAPGAARVQALRRAIRERGVRCLFREPQFQAALVDTLAEGTGVRVAVVDPLGADFPPGPDAWFKMMHANADAIANCLRR